MRYKVISFQVDVDNLTDNELKLLELLENNSNFYSRLRYVGEVIELLKGKENYLSSIFVDDMEV